MKNIIPILNTNAKFILLSILILTNCGIQNDQNQGLSSLNSSNISLYQDVKLKKITPNTDFFNEKILIKNIKLIDQNKKPAKNIFVNFDGISDISNDQILLENLCNNKFKPTKLNANQKDNLMKYLKLEFEDINFSISKLDFPQNDYSTINIIDMQKRCANQIIDSLVYDNRSKILNQAEAFIINYKNTDIKKILEITQKSVNAMFLTSEDDIASHILLNKDNAIERIEKMAKLLIDLKNILEQNDIDKTSVIYDQKTQNILRKYSPKYLYLPEIISLFSFLDNELVIKSKDSFALIPLGPVIQALLVKIAQTGLTYYLYDKFNLKADELVKLFTEKGVSTVSSMFAKNGQNTENESINNENKIKTTKKIFLISSRKLEIIIAKSKMIFAMEYANDYKKLSQSFIYWSKYINEKYENQKFIKNAMISILKLSLINTDNQKFAL